MIALNQNFQNLPGNYLFAKISQEVNNFRLQHPDRILVDLGIGDVRGPLAPAVIEAMKEAVDEMSNASTFRGYGPYGGYDFLVEAIIKNDYTDRGIKIDAADVFVSDGSKSDSGNIGDIFSAQCAIAVCDPVYPVYVDANVMAGRTGRYDPETGRWSDILTLPCDASTGFLPRIPSENDGAPFKGIIYLCFPNNPTGVAAGREHLTEWVRYARETGSIIIYDAAYEAFIREDVPHSIYEIEGARECAIEMKSFSKTAGFTGVRCGYTVIPAALQIDGVRVRDLWARRQSTKFNGVSYVTQRAAEAVYSPEGKVQIRQTIDACMQNAKLLREGFADCGYEVYGGVNAPYIWIRTPNEKKSWEYFDYLLNKAAIVVTPGAGFGAAGEGYFRAAAFGSREHSEEAIERIKQL